MKIRYTMHKMNPLKRNIMEADLMRYMNERRLRLSEDLRKIQGNKGVAIRILNQIRKNMKAGLTLNALISALESAADTTIFDYKIKNGRTKGDVILDVSMASIYFETAALMKNILPRFSRRKHDGADISKQKWIDWFEKNLCEYHPGSLWEKEVLEA